MADFTTLRLEGEGPIRRLTLAEPPANHTSLRMYSEIARAVDLVARDPAVKVLVLTGAGEEAFCAGANPEHYAALRPEDAPGRNQVVRQAFFSLYDCPVPVVGAINGLAAGAGLALAASCDILVAAEQASFMYVMTDLGLFGAARHGARLFGEPVMRRMYFTGEPLPAREALDYGAVAEVVPLARLMDAADRWARKLAAKDVYTLRQAKICLNTVEAMNLKEAYIREQEFTRAAVERPETLGLIQAVIAQGGTLALSKQRRP